MIFVAADLSPITAPEGYSGAIVSSACSNGVRRFRLRPRTPSVRLESVLPRYPKLCLDRIYINTAFFLRVEGAINGNTLSARVGKTRKRCFAPFCIVVMETMFAGDEKIAGRRGGVLLCRVAMETMFSVKEGETEKRCVVSLCSVAMETVFLVEGNGGNGEPVTTGSSLALS